MYKKLINFLQTYIRRIKDVFTLPPIPNFDKEIKNTWGDWNIKPNEQIQQEDSIPYDDTIVEVEYSFLDDRHISVLNDSEREFAFCNKLGSTSNSSCVYYFWTNFEKEFLKNYIEAIKLLNFPKKSVGICIRAHDKHNRLLEDSYSLYFAREIIPEKTIKKFSEMMSVLYKKEIEERTRPF